MPVLGTPTLLLLVGACLTAGVVLLVLGLWPRRPGRDPHCPKCGYNLTGITSDICPECGTRYIALVPVHGERHRQPGLAIRGLALLLVGLAACIPISRMTTSRPNGGRVINNVKIAKQMVGDLRMLFERGQVESLDGCRPSSKTLILQLLIEDKIPQWVLAHEGNGTVRAAALAELAAADQLLKTRLIPGQEATRKSEIPEDAKALVPLMDQLDTHMDRLLQILRGY